jgi:hypothetical protein
MRIHDADKGASPRQDGPQHAEPGRTVDVADREVRARWQKVMSIRLRNGFC